jgi:hypothetical protein
LTPACQCFSFIHITAFFENRTRPEAEQKTASKESAGTALLNQTFLPFKQGKSIVETAKVVPRFEFPIDSFGIQC